MLELLPPAAILLVGALVIAVVPRRVGGALMLALPVLAFAQLLALEPGTSLSASFYGFEVEPLAVDRLSLAFGYVFCIAAFIAGLYGLQVMGTDERVAATMYAGSALGVVLAGDLLSLFVFWEIKAIGSTFLVWARRTEEAGRAGKRYLYMQLAGGKLLLAGILWHIAATGSIEFTAMDPGPAAVLMLLGFLMAAAVPPLHPWLPDAYPQATIAGTVFLSAYTTKASVYALARGFAGYEILVWLGVAMALYGVVYAVLENDIRRLLGYHIISQVGYMVAAVGIGTEMALNGATAHAFAHILYKGLLLMGAGAVLYAVGESLGTRLGGLARKMKAVLTLYMVGAVSISGFPLFSGFVSKELTMEAASLDERALVVILLKIASVGTFLHTGLKLPYMVWFGRDRGLQPRPVPPSMYAAMGAAAVINFAIGVQPWLLYDLLPFPVPYTPYYAEKLVEMSQVLLFTGLGFLLLLKKLAAEPTVSLDTDWFYRDAPFRIAGTVKRLRPERQPGRAGPGVLERFPPLQRAPLAGAKSPVYPTWLLGASILGVSVLILALALIP